MIGRFETGGPHVPCRENGSLEEKARPFPTLTWMKRAGNMHRVSLGRRHGRPRGKRLREASRYRRNATLSDYGVTQDRTTMNTLRRLCGTMPPTHVPHPPISFAVQLLHRNGAYLLVFRRGRPSTAHKTFPLPVVLGVKGLPASLRRRQVLCTLPILRPCVPRHALHC